MIVVLILVTAIVVFLGYIYWKQTFSDYAKKIKCFPGPATYPVLGNVLQFQTTPDKIFVLLRDLANTFSKPYLIWAAHIPILNIITAEDAEVLLSSNSQIDKGFFYDFLSDWLGRGLLTSTGKKWQHRRKLLTPSFHFNILQKFVETMGSYSQQLVQRLEEEYNKSETNIIPIISNSALKIICDTAMGISFDLSDKKQNRYCQSVYDLGRIFVVRVSSPWLFNSTIFNLLPIGRRSTKSIKILHKFVKTVIKERESNFIDLSTNVNDEIGIKKRLAMLDLLLSAKLKEGSIDDEGIQEEVDTFMFEGHDTVSAALVFAFMILANNKDHQDKIVEELKEIFGDSTEPANYEDLNKMQYLELCIKESMRLNPSVPLVTRKTNSDIILGDTTVPAGTEIIVHIYDIHRDPRYFPNPETFNPERFLPENTKGRHPFAYIPFSAGPRNCIGQKFAMLEMKSVISAVLRNFILEPVTLQKDIKYNVEMILRSTSDIYVKFRQRKSN